MNAHLFTRRLRRLFIGFVVFLILLLGWGAANALKPAKVPDPVIALGQGVQTIHKGVCPRPGGDMLCIVGMHETEPYGMMLLFQEHGILVQVIVLEPPDKEKIVWTHPDWTI
jgi:hypothetical protein